MVIYRSKMHAGLKRNFQVMPGAEWLELLCKHIPDRYEHLVRYVGWYSNRARGERAKKVLTQAGAALPVDEAPRPALRLTFSAREHPRQQLRSEVEVVHAHGLVPVVAAVSVAHEQHCGTEPRVSEILRVVPGPAR